MLNSAPPIVLTFGLFDPSGATGLQADLLTLAGLGCHAATVLTGYAVRDSATCATLQGIDPEHVAEQARMVLEDMPVAAFKIGAAMRAETVSAIAEVVADYDEIPLILAADFSLDPSSESAAEELRESIAELLAPQSTLLVADAQGLMQIAMSDDDEDALSIEGALAQVMGNGCEYVLLGQSRPGRRVHTLYGEEGELRSDEWSRGEQRILGLDDTLATAIAALMATGSEAPAAVREAQEFLYHASVAAFRPGMGAMLLDRSFGGRGAATPFEANESSAPHTQRQTPGSAHH